MALINLRNAMMAGGKKVPTVSDYAWAQSGLMLDSENNGGVGVHVSDASVWRNLFTNTDIGRGSSNAGVAWAWGENYLQTSAASGWAKWPLGVSDSGTLPGLTADTEFTVEMVFASDSGDIIMQHPGTMQANRYVATCDASGIWSVSIILPNLSQCYINGVSATQYQGLTVTSNAPQAAARFIFGGRYDGCPGGKLYRATVYPRALTASEISANYAIDKARFGLT